MYRDMAYIPKEVRPSFKKQRRIFPWQKEIWQYGKYLRVVKGSSHLYRIEFTHKCVNNEWGFNTAFHSLWACVEHIKEKQWKCPACDERIDLDEHPAEKD